MGTYIDITIVKIYKMWSLFNHYDRQLNHPTHTHMVFGGQFIDDLV
jgi:hypothetical protein